jgi:hypothetical protein
MTDDDKTPKTDDVPEGFTLDETPTAAAATAGGGADVPGGFTADKFTKPAGGGILQNPGGDAPGHEGFGGNVPTQPEQMSVTNFLTNKLPGSIINTAQNLTSAVIHPIRTGEGLGNLVAGTFKAAARGAGFEMPENESDQVARNFLEYAKNRWGGVDQIKNALYQDPVGMMMDFSALLSGAGGVLRGAGALSGIETASEMGRMMGEAGEVANPLYVPGKVASGVIGKLAPKPLPGFDPKNATFAGEDVPFDPSTGTFHEQPGGYRSPQPEQPPPNPPPKPPESTQEAVNRLRSQWGVKSPKSGVEAPTPPPAPRVGDYVQWESQGTLKLPKPLRVRGFSDDGKWAFLEGSNTGIPADQLIHAPTEAPPAEPPPAKPPAQPAAPPPAKPAGWKAWAGPLASVGITGAALEYLTHHMLGSLGAGALAGGAVKYLPQLLKSEAGQRMLATIGPDSNAAALASVAKNLVPALNTLYQSGLQQQSMGEHSAFDQRAKGGMVNPELARIERQRLPLLGIHDMLQRKN